MVVVQVVSTSQDHTRNAKRTTSKTFFIKSSRSDGTFTVIASPSQDVSPEVVASAISYSGKLTTILRETNSAGDKKQFVEVWEGERLEVSVNVTKAHGVFYTDGEVHSSPPHPLLSPPGPPPRHTDTPETFSPLDQLSTLAFSPSELSC